MHFEELEGAGLRVELSTFFQKYNQKKAPTYVGA